MAKIFRFPVVEKARKKAGKPPPVPFQWTCRVCEHQIGVASSEIMQIRIAPRIRGMKIEGGTKRWVCAKCYQRGVSTEVF